ncbi:transposase [Thiohalorhabdus denitrificans]|uniref:Transposase n=1 Tax=Thiohalorhabdus denitrificans TaxID=381306 RepID=A0A1G5D426_9GAMM|nr:Transposase [Thiohalorhabdus denitrificans]
MAKSQPRYSAKFREQMVELVRAGRSSHELAEEFEPSARTFRNWFFQAERDAGQRTDGLTSEERTELVLNALETAIQSRQPALPKPHGGQAGTLRIHRGLAQPEATPFRPWPTGPEGL